MKPAPGTCLWGSPLHTLFGWRKWADEHYPERTDFSKYFCFDFQPWARVMLINSPQDYENCPKIGIVKCIDFEAIYRSGFSAIWLTSLGLISSTDNFDMYMGFYGWDCDSVAVLNPDSILTK